MVRLNATLSIGMYSILDDFCHTGFLAYYTLENKPSKAIEYPDKLDGNLIENNHKECSYPRKIKFMILGETMCC